MGGHTHSVYSRRSVSYTHTHTAYSLKRVGNSEVSSRKIIQFCSRKIRLILNSLQAVGGDVLSILIKVRAAFAGTNFLKETALLLPPPFSRKALETPQLAKGELADRTSELPSLSVPFWQEAGSHAISWTFPKTPVCSPYQHLSVCLPPQPNTCHGREGMGVGKQNVPTVGGEEEARKGQTEEGGLRGKEKTHEHGRWCGLGGNPRRSASNSD